MTVGAEPGAGIFGSRQPLSRQARVMLLAFTPAYLAGTHAPADPTAGALSAGRNTQRSPLLIRQLAYLLSLPLGSNRTWTLCRPVPALQRAAPDRRVIGYLKARLSPCAAFSRACRAGAACGAAGLGPRAITRRACDPWRCLSLQSPELDGATIL